MTDKSAAKPTAGDGAAMFTAADALAVLRRLEKLPSIVLVGGQALNFWAEQFRSEAPALERLTPFQSRDVDFLGAVSDVALCARALNGAALYPSPDHVNTPEVGIVRCVVNGKTLKIDVLGYLAGLRRAAIEKAAIRTEIEGVMLRVLHPVHVLQSRLANVIQLRRRDELSLRQMRAAIAIVVKYIERAAAQAPRVALDLVDAVVKIACSRDATRLWHDHGIDIALAIRAYDGLPPQFVRRRLPQARREIDKRRAKYQRVQAAIADRKRAKAH